MPDTEPSQEDVSAAQSALTAKMVDLVFATSGILQPHHVFTVLGVTAGILATQVVGPTEMVRAAATQTLQTALSGAMQQIDLRAAAVALEGPDVL